MSLWPQSNMTGEEATARGYRRVSNRYRGVARIDRPDWLERLAKHLMREPADLMSKSGKTVQPGWPGFYRRVLSKDVVVLTEREYRKVPSSDHDTTGYIAPEESTTGALQGTPRFDRVCGVRRENTDMAENELMKVPTMLPRDLRLIAEALRCAANEDTKHDADESAARCKALAEIIETSGQGNVAEAFGLYQALIIAGPGSNDAAR